jgi:acyl transferase domain-containing protein/predicted O-methyltransferase YrrM
MTPPTDAQGAAVRRAYLALEQLQSRLAELERARTEPIAVVGMACRFPGGADDPDAFWRLLRDGVDAVTEVPRERWDVAAYYDPDPAAPGRTATRFGAFLKDVDRFDAAFFGISPREAAALDPQQRLLLEVAWSALEHAGLAADRLLGSKTGVFVGIASRDYSQLQLASGDPARLDAYFASGSAHSMAAGRLSYVLGLQGPSMAIDTACSSSLVAVHLACLSLRAGECRAALAGGVHLTLSPEATIAFSKARMLAPDGRCKTFAAAADGFSEGEGCGIVVLKRLSDALADGDPVLAVVRGSAVNQDGASAGLTAPNGPAQQAVIREALARAGVAPADVTYVEAHGTGTSLGDPIEVQALGAVLGEGRAPDAPLLIGSVKTNVGHLEAAAGVAGLIKAVLAVQRGEIPAQLHFDTPNPHIPWAQLPVEVVARRRPWPAGRPRIAGVSAFGFSGTNVHVLVEAAPAREAEAADGRAQALALSAKSEAALRALAGRWAEALDRRGEVALADLAHTASAGRAPLTHRLALVADATPGAGAMLRAVAAGEAAPGVLRGRAPAGDPPRVAFLFTGQGAQQAGMGRELYEGEPVFHAAIDRVAAAVAGEMERPLLDVLYGGAGAAIDDTANTQPALFAVEWALAELWRAWGVQPALVLGHSVGELVAACVAGVLAVEEAARLVAVRGRLMQALPRGGAMSAVFADEPRVRQALRGREARVGIAAVNGPASVVVSGEAAAVADVVAELGAAGVRSEALRVSHAFHSPLMEPMLEAFARAAAGVTFAAPRLPLVSNLTGEIARGGELGQAGYWVRHVRETVRFAAAMAAAERAGLRTYLEVGPHPVLAGLGAQCVSDATWIASLRRGRGDRATFLEAAARLWVGGVPVDWAAAGRGRARVAGLPTYPFERQRYWLSAAPAGARARAAGGHPLLGSRVRSPLVAAQFEARLAPDAPAFLGEHRVDGAVVLPATAYLEMARAAAAALGHAACDLDDVTIAEALAIPDGGCAVQVVVGPEDGGGREVQVCALDDPAGPADAAWRVHARGRLVPPAAPPPPVALADVRARCPEALSGEAFYATIDGRGVELGPSFRGVQRVWRRDGEALGEIRLPAAAQGDRPSYTIHPVLLDACVQVIAAALPPRDETVYLPIALDRCSAVAPVPDEVWSVVDVRPGEAGETLAADVRVVDAGGRPVVALHGLRLKRVGRETLARASARRLAERIYEIAWRPAPLPASSPLETAPVVASVAPVAGRVAREVERWRGDEGLARYDAAWPQLERLCVAWVAGALRDLGADLHEGATLAPDRLPVAPARRRLLARLLELLAEAGVLAPAAGGWRVACTPAPDAAPACARALDATGGAVQAELAFVRRCGPRLADVLRGSADPLALLFPDGSLADAEALYHDSPPARAYGALAAEALRGIAEALPPGRRLRVLEIGGGTGGTTAALLPVLPRERTDYLFTDISPLFTARAADRFAAHVLRARPLDIDADPVAQGFEPGRFDVIVASNVLHATADLKATLGRCRTLLAPGGVLLLLEVTEPQNWIDVTFGLTDGWWKFVDEALRGGYPLLSAPAWRAVLEATGFDEVSAVPDRAAVQGVLSRQALVLARAAAAPIDAAPAPTGVRLVVADAGGVGERLARRLRERGERCVLVRRGAAYRLGGDEATLDPLAPSQVERLVADVLDDGPASVIHLGALDVPADPTAAVSAGAPLQACASVLHLVQALVARTAAAPRLWLATRRAQAVAPADDVAAGQAPVWGLAHTIALEHPELGCVCVDLDDGGDDDVAALLAELSTAGDEAQVAIRAGRRHVARLVRRAVGETPAATPARPARLGRPASGSLDDVRLEPLARRAPGPGEVEVRVRATGLNFKDVLNALGMYPGDPGPLGSECAGTVTAVGAGVGDLRPGQDVIAIAPGSFATHVVAPADLVVGKPAALTFEEAAALPIAYVTAAHALLDVGRMRAGERVLVHAAAGGVGLAAVRLAQRHGLEVFATAGSAVKRDFLRAQGVAHVFDSRTLDFGDEVLARTGGRGVDLVLNSLSGDAIARSVAALARGGRFLEIGKRGIWTAAEMAAARPDVTYTVIDWGEVARVDPRAIRARLVEVVEAVRAGTLALLPLTVFPLADAAAAFRHMAQARHIGKIAVAQGPDPAAPAVRADATYLITGGLGGLGLVVARWLVERGARSLVLMGRRPPSAAAEAALAALRAAGAEVVVALGDVARAADVERALAGIDGARPLRGVFHAAGALDDGVLAQQDPARFARVLAAKVDGTAHLDRLTRAAPLDLFVLFSSVASVFGSSGQANHAAANAFLDALAHRRRAAGLPALSVNWGAWSEVGAAVGERVSRRIARQGLSALAPAEALRALATLLDERAVQAAVVAVDWPSLLAGFPAGRRPALFAELASTLAAPAPAAAGPRLIERLRAVPEARREALLVDHVAQRTARVLGLDGGQPIDPLRPLKELGIDSLMAVELRNLLKADLALDTTLPATLVFDHPTVDAIARFLERLVFGETPPPPAPAPAAGALDRIEQLSDDEVDRLLSERLGGA